MHRKITIKALTLLFLLASFTSFASDSKKNEEPQSKDQYIKEYIQHHLKDTYDFGLFSITQDDGTKKHIGFPLPVILWDEIGRAHV